MKVKPSVLEALSPDNFICDDCLSEILNIKPRQAINKACRDLAAKGLVLRSSNKCEKCFKHKISNHLNIADAVIKSELIVPSENLARQANIKEHAQSGVYKMLLDFMDYSKSENLEIYNEFSLQHELGIFLRKQLPNYLVQFERNVRYFSNSKFPFTKKEIDISIFTEDKSQLIYAIELKYPKNGQYPETMFNICKDIAFVEELKIVGFTQTAVLTLVDDELFYAGSGGGIYDYFRKNKPLTGLINKPTGAKDSAVTIKGSYSVNWHDWVGKRKFTIVEI
jgi:hypothetical protein